ncbi:MAG TPA: acyl-CoA reductase, partial [Chitinophagaceae bacterium]
MGMNLQKRIGSLVQLREYLLSETEEWKQTKQKAYIHNKWFIPEFIDLAVHNIADKFLSEENLRSLAKRYNVPEENEMKMVGIVPAGNIPLVGFHDILCTYLAGHHAAIKPSSKDEVLIKHLIDKLKETDEENEAYFSYKDSLKGCDGYIATGSNNTSRYFEHYFESIRTSFA